MSLITLFSIVPCVFGCWCGCVSNCVIDDIRARRQPPPPPPPPPRCLSQSPPPVASVMVPAEAVLISEYS